MSTAADLSAYPPEARAALARYLDGEGSAEIALMHLMLATGSVSALAAHLQRLATSRNGPLERLAAIAAERRDALTRTAGLIAAGLTRHGDGDPIAAIREQFERAVAAAPEAAVALYSLGDSATLARATAELAGLLDNWGLLGASRDALDIGCGIGRLEPAIAPRLRRILGIDLSPAMVAEAKRRCPHLANVRFAVCDGTGLSPFAGLRFDLILAVDCFPYLVAAGARIAERHIAEATGMLNPGGALAIFNYSYRGDLAADRTDIAAHAARAGLLVERNGTRDLNLWDGTSFLLRAPARRG